MFHTLAGRVWNSTGIFGHQESVMCTQLLYPGELLSRTPVIAFLTALPLHLPEEAITTNEVINQLLHHVGAMCIHQLNLLATNPNLPITSVLGKQHPIEARHLSSICDIMEKAMVNGDTCIVRCILVVFQVHVSICAQDGRQEPPFPRSTFSNCFASCLLPSSN